MLQVNPLRIGQPRLAKSLAAILTIVFISACGSAKVTPTPSPTSRPILAYQPLPPGLAQAEETFSVQLLQQLSALGEDSNIVASPSSVATALAMLQVGAKGDTASQIASVLNTSSMTADQQAAAWQTLTADLVQTGHPDIALQIANQLWLQKGFNVNSSFTDTLQRRFSAGVSTADFKNDPQGAVKMINDWVNQQTNGKIPSLVSQLDKQTLLLLADAVYFKGPWSVPFSPQATKPDTFHLASGGDVTVPFMNGTFESSGWMDSSSEGVELPFQGGRFVADVIMPTSGSLADFVHNLTANQLDATLAQATSQADVSLPKFKFAGGENLIPVLQSLGMKAAFEYPAADFSGIDNMKDLYVSLAIQKADISVDEAGTEAAAATALGLEPGAARQTGQPLDLTFNHPFLFLIRDTATGAIVFTAQVADPSSSDALSTG